MAAPNVVVQLVSIIHYRALCRTCGWSGTEWGIRGDADEDVRTHVCAGPCECIRSEWNAEHTAIVNTYEPDRACPIHGGDIA